MKAATFAAAAFAFLFAAPIGTSSSQERLLVKFRPGTDVRRVERAAGVTDRLAIRGIGVRVVNVGADRASAALATLHKSANVVYAERDSVLQPQDVLPSDPSFPTHFAVAGGAWGWTQTHTTQAWDITHGDPSVVVAILDTGLRTAGLDDFNGQVVPGWNVLNGSSDVSTSAGVHGTYVAGAVGLALNNDVGNAGYCPGCRIMPIQVGNDAGAYLSDMASGLTWAADHGARVANMSWAGSTSSATLADAVSYARSKGVVVTAAAGNSACDCPTYPAATPGVLGVASTDQADAKQANSNYGSWVKVAAPEGTMTAWPALNGAPGYAPVGGTSLAAPVVAGIAGLLFSAKPSLTGAQAEQALESTAVPETFVQYGRVDALAALNTLGFADPQAASKPTNLSPPRVLVETNGDYNTVQLPSAPQVGQVLLRGQGSWVGSAPLSLASVQWQRCDALGATCSVIATAAKYTVQAIDAGSTLRVVITVSNGLGSTTIASAATLPVGGTAPAPAPAPPTSTSAPVISGSAQAGQTLTVSAGTWSGSPSSYTYAWRRCDTTGASCTTLTGVSGSSYALQSADVGSTIVAVVTATNAAGSASAASAPTAPVASAPTAPPPPSAQTQTFSGSLNGKNTKTFTVAVGAGPANARLAFSKCANLNLALDTANGNAIANAAGPSVVALDAVVAAGTYTYVVGGGRCSFTLTVTTPLP